MHLRGEETTAIVRQVCAICEHEVNKVSTGTTMTIEYEEEMIDRMWSALIEDPDFQPMIDAWDELANATSIQSEKDYIGVNSRLYKDFVRLEAAFKAALQANSSKPKTAEPSPWTLKVDEMGQILEITKELAELPIQHNELGASLVAKDWSTIKSTLFRVYDESTSQSLILMLAPRDYDTNYPKLFEAAKIDTAWQERYNNIVGPLFSLTPAEVSVLVALYQGKESSEIAQDRNRSVYTVRTQVKNIMDKVGVSNQRQLVKIVGSVLHHFRNSIGKEGSKQRIFDTGSGHTIAYCDYGDPSGRLVLFVSTIAPPVPNESFEKYATNYGLRIIAPYKPGSGGSSDRHKDDGPIEISRDYVSLVRNVSPAPVIVVGHASGGVYACAAAKALGDDCVGVLTIDSGMPMVSARSIFKMPLNARRTFLAARFAPSILLAPHKVAANDFHSGEQGKRRVAEFFVDGHALDTERVRTDEYYYNAIKDLVAYCFENIPLMIRDISSWSKDWSQLASAVPKSAKKVALIGDNMLFQTQEFEAWCKSDGWKAAVIADEGQLLLFSKQKTLFEHILGIINR